MIRANGKAYSDGAGLTLSAFLSREGYEAVRVVVERNRQIVPKREFDHVVLQDGDELEIIHFVGGG